MLSKSDWNEYAGMPDEFFAAPGDRILHEEIPEQVEEFWSDFLQGRNGSGFAKIDCPENRETLLRKYREAYGFAALVVRSALNETWRRYVITHSAFDHGFIDPNPEPEVDERPRDATGRVSPKALQWRDWTAWVTDPETSMRAILEKRRTDPAFAEFYAHHSAAERTATPVGDSVENLNVRQFAPSASASTSRKVASPEVQRFAQDYRSMSTQQIKTLLAPGLNPLGPAAAKYNQELFDQACALGLI